MSRHCCVCLSIYVRGASWQQTHSCPQSNDKVKDRRYRRQSTHVPTAITSTPVLGCTRAPQVGQQVAMLKERSEFMYGPCFAFLSNSKAGPLVNDRTGICLSWTGGRYRRNCKPSAGDPESASYRSTVPRHCTSLFFLSEESCITPHTRIGLGLDVLFQGVMSAVVPLSQGKEDNVPNAEDPFFLYWGNACPHIAVLHGVEQTTCASE